MFRLDKLTQKAQEALQQCQAIAEQNGSQVMFPLHLLIALAEEKEGIVRPVLEKCGVHPDAILSEARRMVQSLPKSSGMQPGVYLSQPLNNVMERAFDEATRFKDEFVSTEHLLLAIAEQRSDPAGQLLDRAGATHDAILKALVGVRGTQRITDQNPESKYQALERYARDLTELARQDKLDPVIGRDDEIRRVMQVLSRRTKNNPVLIGEPGVGKTAIVEGLAQRIVRGDIPDQLRNKKLVAIDLGSMIAGTKFRGEFEDRLKAVVREIIDSNGEIICFIDELHTLVGAGGAEGAIDAANLLKPALARGELRCIGATTLNEYKKHVEKDAALARRFQTVLVGEPTVDDTIAILRGLKEKFEIHHGVRIKDSAIIAAAVLSQRYIADRFLPDKAIDLIDEAGSALRLQIGSMPIEIDVLERRISHLEIERQALTKEPDPASHDRLRHVEDDLERLRGEAAVLKERWNREKGAIGLVRQLKEEQNSLRQEEEKASRAGDWEKAAQLRYGRLSQIEKEIQAAEQQLESVKENALLKEEIGEDDIARIVAKWTGIPVTRMMEGEIQKLVHMPERLKDRVVGQDEAVRLVSNAILRNRAGLSDPARPIGSFIFLGPTGVGKTELVRALAHYLFDDDKAMIRVDMSEYMEKHAVARMIGSPPGYVGYEEGGQLTEQVRRRPYSVVLFDEIEKAHPDVFNMLLQILDDGRLTDGQGRTVSFRNVVIVMTSNVGTGMVDKNTIGFSVHARDKNTEDTRKRLLDKLREAFRPEFLNRVDDIIVFNTLSRENLSQIVDIQLETVARLLKDRKIGMEVTAAAKDRIISEGYDPQYGARPMRRAIQRLIQDPLALKLINGDLVEGDAVLVDAKPEAGELEITKLVPVAV
jgi:ATP-dependent Clp protease ATP-binding subunit ClpB